MGDSEKRNWESYKNLAQVDFKCLENEIYKMNSGAENSKLLFEKLLEIIDPLEDKRCDYIGQCIEGRDKSAKECKKCKGYWCTTDETFDSYYKMWKEWKNRKGVDLDDSNSARSNPFMRAVYYLLWGKKIDLGYEIKEGNCGIREYGWGRFSASYVFPVKSEGMSKPKALLFGSDTMNTIKSYQKEIENFLQEKKEIEKVDELCRKCHQLGNFVLVPAYYNSCRGAKDQIDVALDRLCNGKNFDGGFIGQTKLRPSGNVTKEEKERVADKYFYRWDKNYFTQFINMFFLWDYVKKKDEKTYYVKDMKSNGEPVTSNTNVNEGNVGKYIINANAYIEKRSIFMAAMLEIAVEYENVKIRIKDYEPKAEWGKWKVSDIYKYIVEKVFLKDKTYSGYKEVIEAIEGVIDGVVEKVLEDDIILLKRIKDNILANIEELKVDTNDEKRSD